MKNWSLSRRLAGVFGVIALVAVPVAGLSFWMIAKSSRSLDYVVANDIPVAKLATEFERELLKAHADLTTS